MSTPEPPRTPARPRSLPQRDADVPRPTEPDERHSPERADSGGSARRPVRRRGEVWLVLFLVLPSAGLLAGPGPELPLPPPPSEATSVPAAGSGSEWGEVGSGVGGVGMPAAVPPAVPGAAPPRSRFRPFQRRTSQSLPSPIVPDPLMGVLTVEIVSRPEPACDPVLYGLWMAELRTALNATPRLRVVEGAGDPVPLEVVPSAAGESGWTDLRLEVTVRWIEPYRPMRIDADLCLTDRTSGAPLARLDGVWQAPVDGVPLKPTRQGWFRRDWRPPPGLSEAAALEANSPRMFLRGTAARMAEALAEQVDAALCPTCPTGSDW